MNGNTEWLIRASSKIGCKKLDEKSRSYENSNILLKNLSNYDFKNYDDVKKINFTGKIDKRKYRLDDRYFLI